MKRSKFGSKKVTKVEPKHKAQSKDAGLHKYLKIDCLLCYRFEETPLQGSETKSKHSINKTSNPDPVKSEHQLPPSQGDNFQSASTSQFEASKPPTTYTSSKKRANARKQGGLQAMLEKSKIPKSSSSGFGLDLLDLMKEG